MEVGQVIQEICLVPTYPQLNLIGSSDLDSDLVLWLPLLLFQGWVGTNHFFVYCALLISQNRKDCLVSLATTLVSWMVSLSLLPPTVFVCLCMWSIDKQYILYQSTKIISSRSQATVVFSPTSRISVTEVTTCPSSLTWVDLEVKSCTSRDTSEI